MNNQKIHTITNVTHEEDFLRDEKTFEYCFRTYYALLVSYAAVFIKETEIAEDIVQELFIGLWDKRDTVRIKTNLKSYLLSSVKNRCFDRLRVLKNRPESANMEEVDISEDFFDRVELKETNQAITKAIDSLSPQCKLTYVLCRIEGFTYAETADLMNISVKTVENHMGRALKSLKILLHNPKESALSFILLLILINFYN